MASKMENPAGGRGNPVTDLAGASINPEYAIALRNLQAVHLTRRCALSFTMAAIVAQLHYQGGARE